MSPSEEKPVSGCIGPTDFLRKAAEFTWVREHGKTVAGRYIVVSRAPAPDDQTRLGIVVSRRCCRQAVGRNRGRRLIRESFRLCRHDIETTGWVVVIARHNIVRAKMQDVQTELLKLLSRLDKAETK